MTGDGAIPVSPKSASFPGRTARNACSGHTAPSSTVAMVRVGVSPERCADKAPTPFFDLLTSMIEAHAAESRRLLQNVGATGCIDSIPNIAHARAARRTDVNAAPPATNHGWRAQQLNVRVVGLIVALGSVFYVSEAGEQQQPPVIAAAEAFQARLGIIGNANANDKQIERPLAAGEPGSKRTIGVEQQLMDEGGVGIKSDPDARLEDRTVVTPVVGQPIEKLGSDTENQAGSVAAEQMPSERTQAHSTAPALNASAEEPSREAVSPPSIIPETRSVAERTNDPVAIQVARVISGVNLRAGPSNGQPVLATIPRGSPIEVIKCRYWCEVIFAGQRGWVYKTFIRAPLADAAMSPEGTSSTPRKAGSNSGASRGTRTWVSDPRRLKPATVRLSAGQSTRDARSRGQSSSRPILWEAIEYLWKQIRPTALLPNAD
jgi:SH3 domain-containing protein